MKKHTPICHPGLDPGSTRIAQYEWIPHQVRDDIHNKIRLHRLALKHLKDIQDISRACFSDPKEHLLLSFLLSLWVSSQRLYGWVAIYQGNSVGYILLDVVRKSKTADLLSMAVLPNFRNHGFGKKLLHAALEECKTNIDEIFLEVRSSNLVAHRLYEQAGFTKVDELKNYYGPNEDAKVYTIYFSSKNGRKVDDIHCSNGSELSDAS